jgi:hypothetical protein
LALDEGSMDGQENKILQTRELEKVKCIPLKITM